MSESSELMLSLSERLSLRPRPAAEADDSERMRPIGCAPSRVPKLPSRDMACVRGSSRIGVGSGGVQDTSPVNLLT